MSTKFSRAVSKPRSKSKRNNPATLRTFQNLAGGRILFTYVQLGDVSKGQIERTLLPPLPITIANAGGTIIGSTLYVVGGIERPDSAWALKRLFALDLASRETQWKELDALPGPSRIFPIIAAYDGALFVFGGAELMSDSEGRIIRRYLKDAFRFQPGQGWKPIADLPKALAAAPSVSVRHRRNLRPRR